MANNRISKLDGQNALRMAYAFLRQEINDQSMSANNLDGKTLDAYMKIENELYHYFNEQK